MKHTFLKWKPKNGDETSVLQENEIPPVIDEEMVISQEVYENISDGITKIDLNKQSTSQEISEPGPSSGNRHAESASFPKSEIYVDNSSGTSIVEYTNFTKSEIYNGAAFENYCWSQTFLDVDIVIRIPDKITAKDLKVVIATKTISVKLKDQILLQGELCQKCKHNDAIWSLDRNRLQVHLDKCQEKWWNCLVTSENRLDLSKIDCSRPFEDLPQEAQAKIEELGWNQERKRLGLPTSTQLARDALLKRAWNAEGSPFSGPFDPSKVEFHEQ